MTWLPPSWEVRTKVSCDALTPVVGTSKPTLEESFQARADIFISVTKNPSRLCHREVSHNEIVIIVLKSKGYGIFDRRTNRLSSV